MNVNYIWYFYTEKKIQSSPLYRTCYIKLKKLLEPNFWLKIFENFFETRFFG